ncbi:hypothetical protein [Sphingomonas yabuuchiae]|uniref:Uncharacterized protein n=1 Tax=Sphingomonas yabuuchiae TaxID=172044 RepID=A0AA41A0F7_9SPHN|nr:hypothetical protein [Sphingomonas yabuuchiae]MBB4610785.1 hypothetical protein [Sphingomonas yabuuchiae]MBN3557700.1 hypothetical protein [Sphingomonas yabuuchiae]
MISFTCAPFALPVGPHRKGCASLHFRYFSGRMRMGRLFISRRHAPKIQHIADAAQILSRKWIEAVRRLLAFEAEAKGSPS